jgi:hypothetical protein
MASRFQFNEGDAVQYTNPETLEKIPVVVARQIKLPRLRREMYFVQILNEKPIRHNDGGRVEIYGVDVADLQAVEQLEAVAAD